jgi:hypothetical protein
MKKLLGIIILMMSFNSNAEADYGGWIDMIKNYDEHKYCGDYARNSGEDDWKQTDIYFDCRENLDRQKLSN